MLDLLHTLPADMRMAAALDAQQERYQYIRIPTLLLQGDKSPVYFTTGINALSMVLPHHELLTLQEHDHYSPEGKPEKIAAHIRSFFQ